MIDYLLDSGFLYADIDSDDRHHSAVRAITANLRGNIILPVPAVTETAYFVSLNLGPGSLATFLEDIIAAGFVFESPIPADYLRSAEIIRKYHDGKLDFVDALIFAMAERLNITHILTIDRRHFSMFRPIHCDAFEILP
jgi:predicted nucleic acid-binding protein